jgi:ABC-2 type transport system permease protein
MGLLAFWFEQSIGFFSVYFALWALTSGYIVPMAMLPEGLQDVFPWLPFYGTLGAPVDLLTGGATRPLFVLGVQAAWFLILAATTVLAWKRGIVRYGAVGA